MRVTLAALVIAVGLLGCRPASHVRRPSPKGPVCEPWAVTMDGVPEGVLELMAPLAPSAMGYGAVPLDSESFVERVERHGPVSMTSAGVPDERWADGYTDERTLTGTWKLRPSHSARIGADDYETLAVHVTTDGSAIPAKLWFCRRDEAWRWCDLEWTDSGMLLSRATFELLRDDVPEASFERAENLLALEYFARTNDLPRLTAKLEQLAAQPDRAPPAVSMYATFVAVHGPRLPSNSEILALTRPAAFSDGRIATLRAVALQKEELDGAVRTACRALSASHYDLDGFTLLLAMHHTRDWDRLWPLLAGLDLTAAEHFRLRRSIHETLGEDAAERFDQAWPADSR